MSSSDGPSRLPIAFLICADPSRFRVWLDLKCGSPCEHRILCCRDLAGLTPNSSVVSRVAAYADAFVTWFQHILDSQVLWEGAPNARKVTAASLASDYATEVSAAYVHLEKYINRDERSREKQQYRVLKAIEEGLRPLSREGSVFHCDSVDMDNDSIAIMLQLRSPHLSPEFRAFINSPTGPFVDHMQLTQWTQGSIPLWGAEGSMWSVRPSFVTPENIAGLRTAVSALAHCAEWAHGSRTTPCLLLDEHPEFVDASSKIAQESGAFSSILLFSASTATTVSESLSARGISPEESTPYPAIAFVSLEPVKGALVVARLAAAATVLSGVRGIRSCSVFVVVQGRSLETLDRHILLPRIKAAIATAMYEGSRLSGGFPTSVRLVSGDRGSVDPQAPQRAPGAVVMQVTVEWGEAEQLEAKFSAILEGDSMPAPQAPKRKRESFAVGGDSTPVSVAESGASIMDEDGRATKRARTHIPSPHPPQPRAQTIKPENSCIDKADGDDSAHPEHTTPRHSDAAIRAKEASIPFSPRGSVEVPSPAVKKASVTDSRTPLLRRQPVPVDEQGVAQVPFKIGKITFQSMGTIVYDRPGFHNEDYIYPAGFMSRKVYDPNHQTSNMGDEYQNEIVDSNHDKPLFRVKRLRDGMSWDGSTMTAVWTKVVRSLRDDQATGNIKNVSGPTYFGFGQESFPQIRKYIEEMPNADKCERYWKKRKAATADTQTTPAAAAGAGTEAHVATTDVSKETHSEMPVRDDADNAAMDTEVDVGAEAQGESQG